MSALSRAQLNFFEQNGYLIVESVLSADDIAPIINEFAVVIDHAAATLKQQGELSQTYAELPFEQRYMAILGETTGILDFVEIGFPLENHLIMEETPMHAGDAVFRLLTNPNILDVVECIIGPEITSNPVQHTRIKPPLKFVPKSVAANSYVGKTTWHQDLTGLLDEANATELLTVWVAITDAPKERGCLCVMPGSHKKGGGTITPHCPGSDVKVENFIPSKLLGDEAGNKEATVLPVKKGSIILFNRFTEHAALPNKSDTIRWSFDLRYQPTGQPTGRPAFPHFIARSRRDPSTELHDSDSWRQMWADAKAKIITGEYEGDIYNIARLKAFAQLSVCA